MIFPNTIVNEESKINFNKKNIVFNKSYLTIFVNKWKLEEFKNDLKKITKEPIRLINLSIEKKNIVSYLFDRNNKKVPLIHIYKIIFIYIFKYPYMMNYFSKLYDSLLIYYSIKNSEDLINNDILIKESYSMEMRAMCLVAESNNMDLYKIIYNEDNILPYPVYSLNTKKKINIFNNFINKTSKNNFKKAITTSNKNNKFIIIQPSDSTTSSPTLYEYYCYEDIFKALSSIGYKGKVIFNFHPQIQLLIFILKKLF